MGAFCRCRQLCKWGCTARQPPSHVLPPKGITTYIHVAMCVVQASPRERFPLSFHAFENKHTPIHLNAALELIAFLLRDHRPHSPSCVFPITALLLQLFLTKPPRTSPWWLEKRPYAMLQWSGTRWLRRESVGHIAWLPLIFLFFGMHRPPAMRMHKPLCKQRAVGKVSLWLSVHNPTRGNSPPTAPGSNLGGNVRSLRSNLRCSHSWREVISAKLATTVHDLFWIRCQTNLSLSGAESVSNSTRRNLKCMGCANTSPICRWTAVDVSGPEVWRSD